MLSIPAGKALPIFGRYCNQAWWSSHDKPSQRPKVQQLHGALYPPTTLSPSKPAQWWAECYQDGSGFRSGHFPEEWKEDWEEVSRHSLDEGGGTGAGRFNR